MRVRIACAAAIVLLCGLIPLGTAGAADTGQIHVLVLKDGRSIRVRSWEADGSVIKLVDEKGVQSVIRRDLVDVDRTRAATERARRTPTPTPTPRTRTLVEVAREMQEKQRRPGGGPLEPITSTRLTPPPPPIPGLTGTPPPPPVPTPEMALPTPELVAATPEPIATPAPTAAPVPSVAPPPAEEESSSLPLYGGIGLGVVVLVGAAAVLARKKKPAARRGAAPAGRPVAVAPTPSEDLLTPAFADESPADDLPAPAELADDSFAAPAELGGSSTATRALPEAPAEIANPGILQEGEVQIRISGDVYTCPNLASLKRWVEEGRVIENSEILAPDGSWLMAGTIPDLESAFAARRETLGY